MNTALLSLIIMGICIILFIWDKLSSSIVAMLGCIAMVIFGVCDVPEVLSGFNDDILLLLFGMQVIGLAMFSTGAGRIIGEFSIKIAKNRERRFIAIACIISAALSAFLSNTAVIAMMLAVCQSVIQTASHIKIKNLYIPVAIAAILGGQCTLAGSTPQLVATDILYNASGISIEMFDLMWVGFPITVAVIVYMVFIGYPLGKKIWGEVTENCSESNYEESFNSSEENKTDRKKAIIVCCIFVLVIVLFISGITSIGIAALIGAILCLVSGCITQKEVFEKMDWNCIIWLCCCLGLGNALNISGGAEIIAEKMLGLFDNGTSAFLLFAVMVFVTMLISEFMSNMAALLIVLPSTLDLVIQLGFAPYPFAYGMCLGASLTFATPLANGHIGMTLSGGYRFMDYVKYGTLPNILAYILIVVLTPIFFSLK